MYFLLIDMPYWHTGPASRLSSAALDRFVTGLCLSTLAMKRQDIAMPARPKGALSRLKHLHYSPIAAGTAREGRAQL